MAYLERARRKAKIMYWLDVMGGIVLILAAIWLVERMFHYANYIDSAIK